MAVRRDLRHVFISPSAPSFAAGPVLIGGVFEIVVPARGGEQDGKGVGRERAVLWADGARSGVGSGMCRGAAAPRDAEKWRLVLDERRMSLEESLYLCADLPLIAEDQRLSLGEESFRFAYQALLLEEQGFLFEKNRCVCADQRPIVEEKRLFLEEELFLCEEGLLCIASRPSSRAGNEVLGVMGR